MCMNACVCARVCVCARMRACIPQGGNLVSNMPDVCVAKVKEMGHFSATSE